MNSVHVNNISLVYAARLVLICSVYLISSKAGTEP